MRPAPKFIALKVHCLEFLTSHILPYWFLHIQYGKHGNIFLQFRRLHLITFSYGCQYFSIFFYVLRSYNRIKTKQHMSCWFCTLLYHWFYCWVHPCSCFLPASQDVRFDMGQVKDSFVMGHIVAAVLKRSYDPHPEETQLVGSWIKVEILWTTWVCSCLPKVIWLIFHWIIGWSL